MVEVHWAWIMWSEQIFWEAISAEPTAGTVRGEEVYVHWIVEASSWGKVSSVDWTLDAGSGGVMVVLPVRVADLSCDGAFLRRASAMPCSVSAVTVSFPLLGGVMAMGAISAVLFDRRCYQLCEKSMRGFNGSLSQSKTP